MTDKDNHSEARKANWMGPKGFDEARYYKDEKFEIGINKPDEQIRAKVLEAYSRHPSLSLTDIQVEVRDGLVILDGDVQGPEEKTEAHDLICGLTGVKAVKNNLHF